MTCRACCAQLGAAVLVHEQRQLRGVAALRAPCFLAMFLVRAVSCSRLPASRPHISMWDVR
jgi:hypothetical protein